ncbi:MAG: class I SAM-dependent methyltransferase [bacterium]|nr:class I SAM-dependent methyltransferase [bacterium]
MLPTEGEFESSYFGPVFPRLQAERREISKYYLKLLLELKPEAKSVLDVGFGYGDYLAVAEEQGWETYGVETSAKAVAEVKSYLPQATLLQADASKEKLPFSDEHFDIVTCLDVVEHLTDVHYLFSEVHRVLRRGGIFLLTTPPITLNSRVLGRFMSEDPTHINKHPINYWEETLITQKFRVVGEKYAVFYGFPPTRALREAFRRVHLPVFVRPFFLPIRPLCGTLYLFAAKD